MGRQKTESPRTRRPGTGLNSKMAAIPFPRRAERGTYTVILDDRDAVCDCPDFELRDKPCKHIMAVRLFVRRQERGVEQSEDVQPAKKVKRENLPPGLAQLQCGTDE